MNLAIHGSHAAYDNMMFKEALKTGYYNLQNARDAYRAACGPHGMHKDLGAAMYMQERIEALRRDIDKHGKAKVKKGQQAPPAAKVVHADLFVSDRFTGWRERVFINLSQLYSQQTRGFPADVSQQMMGRESP
ncbi:TPA: hypothetical protein ACH3X3_005641 [Trebouxia sp. C0006]